MEGVVLENPSRHGVGCQGSGTGRGVARETRIAFSFWARESVVALVSRPGNIRNVAFWFRWGDKQARPGNIWSVLRCLAWLKFSNYLFPMWITSHSEKEIWFSILLHQGHGIHVSSFHIPSLAAAASPFSAGSSGLLRLELVHYTIIGDCKSTSELFF